VFWAQEMQTFYTRNKPKSPYIAYDIQALWDGTVTKIYTEEEFNIR